MASAFQRLRAIAKRLLPDWAVEKPSFGGSASRPRNMGRIVERIYWDCAELYKSGANEQAEQIREFFAPPDVEMLPWTSICSNYCRDNITPAGV